MAGLRSKGVTCIMISHKLNEIEKISDSITIIRDGKTVETLRVKEDGVDENRIIRGMVGRDLESRFPDHTPELGETFFEVSGWTVRHPAVPDRLVCKDESFFVRRGEIVGFAGLMGAGRTELMRSLFGHCYGTFVSGIGSPSTARTCACARCPTRSTPAWPTSPRTARPSGSTCSTTSSARPSRPS